MRSLGNSVWCIAFVDSEKISTVNDQIEKAKLPIKALIPSVKVITKKFKGKIFFTEVPLLFNYGFFKIPVSYTHNKDRMESIKSAIPTIFSWMYNHEKSEKQENGHYTPRIIVETTKFQEIIRLKRIGLLRSVYSSVDIDNLQKGSYIVLKGYPFDNIPAEVISINKKAEKVKVSLLVDMTNDGGYGSIREVTVGFSNIFYTIYTEYQDPETRDRLSIESIMERSKFKIDKMEFANGYDED